MEVDMLKNDGLTFPVRFPNIFVDYPLGPMRVRDKLWTNWNEAPLKLWQTQLNYAVFCALSACKVSSAHLNYSKHPMIRSVYRFHIYYHVRRILKRLQTPLPHKTSFNAADHPYTESEFFKICEDYRVPNNPMRYRDEKFYWTYQHSVHWPDDYIGPDSMTRWIIEKSQSFTDVGLLRILESIRAYAYLILSSQASARSSIIEIQPVLWLLSQLFWIILKTLWTVEWTSTKMSKDIKTRSVTPRVRSITV